MTKYRDVAIVTPSYKRSGNIKSINIFGEKLIIAIHNFEKEIYKREYPGNKILIIPDEKRGNMAAVRNFVLDNVDSKYILMVDDDVEEIRNIENGKQIVLSMESIINLIENCYNMAEELGTVLWGINLQTDPKFYREYSPFSLLSVVIGPFSGHIKSDIRYDERLGLNEDYDFAIQVLKKYRKILRFNKYSYYAKHIIQQGGCGAYRTLEREKQQAQTMMKKWGNRIVKYDFGRSTNPVINVPIKGI